MIFGPQTTDLVEGWHNALNLAIGKSSVNIFELAQKLQKEEERFHLDMLCH